VTWSPGGWLTYVRLSSASGPPLPLPLLWPLGALPPAVPSPNKPCIELDQRTSNPGEGTPLDATVCALEFGTIRELMNTSSARRTPSLLDPNAPPTDPRELATDSVHVALDRLARRNPQAAAALMQLPGVQGQAWRDVLTGSEASRMRWREAVLQLGLEFDKDGKTASYREMILRVDEPLVLLSFRQAGDVYVVHWDDPTPTEDLDPLASDVQPADPSFAVASVPSWSDWWVLYYFLYVFFVDDAVAINYDGRPVTQADHPFYRVARGFNRDVGLTSANFAPAEDVSTIMSQVDRYSGAPPPDWSGTTFPERTARAINAVGAHGLVNLFVVGRNLGTESGFGNAGFHRWDCTDPENYRLWEVEGTSVNQSSSGTAHGSFDVLRWGALRPTSWLDGTLVPYGQRMVVMERTEQETMSGGTAVGETRENLFQAGAAWWDPLHRVLSLAFPDELRRRYEIRRLPTRCGSSCAF
jgi:hypothetical protein